MDAREFHTFAGSLAARPNPAKAAIRSAISRAYYALYLRVIELLAEAGVVDPRDTGPFHGKAARYLLNCEDDALSSLGSSLDNNRLLRNRADYEMERVDVEMSKTATTAIEDIEMQLNKIDSIMKDASAIRRVADQINEYRNKTGDR